MCHRRIANCTPNVVTGRRTSAAATAAAAAATVASIEFCEVGVSSVTVLRSHEEGTSTLFCAKRSSAALRSAICAEASSRLRRIDEDGSMLAETSGASVVWESQRDAMLAMAHDGTVASRMRRDCKRALEQRRCASLCGDMPLLTIPIIGRAVRIYGSWYSLCSLCANFVRVTPHCRIEAEIACLRCTTTPPSTSQSSRRKRPATTATGKRACRDAESSELPLRRVACRFCCKKEVGQPQRHRQFVTYPSPHDVAGDNLERSSSCRTTTWCPTHDRSWLRDALTTLTTAQVIAHITTNAQPCAELGDSGVEHTREFPKTQTPTPRQGHRAEKMRSYPRPCTALEIPRASASASETPGKRKFGGI